MYSNQIRVSLFVLLSACASSIFSAADNPAEHIPSPVFSSIDPTEALTYCMLKKKLEAGFRLKADEASSFDENKFKQELNSLSEGTFYIGRIALPRKYDDVPPKEISWITEFRKYIQAELTCLIEFAKKSGENNTLTRKGLKDYFTQKHLICALFKGDIPELKCFFFVRAMQQQSQKTIDIERVMQVFESTKTKIFDVLADEAKQIGNLTLVESNAELDKQWAAFSIPLDNLTRRFIVYTEIEEFIKRWKKPVDPNRRIDPSDLLRYASVKCIQDLCKKMRKYDIDDCPEEYHTEIKARVEFYSEIIENILKAFNLPQWHQAFTTIPSEQISLDTAMHFVMDCFVDPLSFTEWKELIQIYHLVRNAQQKSQTPIIGYSEFCCKLSSQVHTALEERKNIKLQKRDRLLRKIYKESVRPKSSHMEEYLTSLNQKRQENLDAGSTPAASSSQA